MFVYNFQVCKSSRLQMACALDLWVHGLGEYKTSSSLCISNSKLIWQEGTSQRSKDHNGPGNLMEAHLPHLDIFQKELFI